MDCLLALRSAPRHLPDASKAKADGHKPRHLCLCHRQSGRYRGQRPGRHPAVLLRRRLLGRQHARGEWRRHVAPEAAVGLELVRHAVSRLIAAALHCRCGAYKARAHPSFAGGSVQGNRFKKAANTRLTDVCEDNSRLKRFLNQVESSNNECVDALGLTADMVIVDPKYVASAKEFKLPRGSKPRAARQTHKLKFVGITDMLGAQWTWKQLADEASNWKTTDRHA